MGISGHTVVGDGRWGWGRRRSRRAAKPLQRRWWGTMLWVLTSLRVFAEAAGEAAELGEAGPEHGLEHQVGGGAGPPGPLLGAVSAFGRWAQLPPSPQRPRSGCWSFFPGSSRSRWGPPSTPPAPRPVFIAPSRGNEAAGWTRGAGGLAQLFLPRWLHRPGCSLGHGVTSALGTCPHAAL